MLTIHDINELNMNGGTALTIGKFDGLHRGHHELLRTVTGKKGEGLLSAVLMLVSPHPSCKFLLTEKEMEEILKREGVDLFIRLPLTKERMAKPAEDFVREILVEKLHVKHLSCGSDFRFGKGREGDVELLRALSKKYGFSLDVVEKIRESGEEISSTRIRELLSDGNVSGVNLLLGYPYGFSGKIVHGRAIGRTIGFPTVNIYPPEEKLLPKFGVYYAEVVIPEGTYGAVLNLGTKPTVTEEKVTIMEAHLLDFAGDVYGMEAEVRFLRFIRPERRFDGLQALQEQIGKDLSVARRYRDCEQSVNSEKKD